MKRAAVPLWTGLLLALLLCACGGGDVSQAAVDYGVSEHYSEEDREAAAAVILEAFRDFDGCELHALQYAGDDVSVRELEYRKSVGQEFAQCAVFTSSFHSPVNGGGAWAADREYENWSWTLIRKEDGGDWEFLTGGYA